MFACTMSSVMTRGCYAYSLFEVFFDNVWVRTSTSTLGPTHPTTELVQGCGG